MLATLIGVKPVDFTGELVKSMLSAEYVSDSEILQNQCSDGVNVNINQPAKKIENENYFSKKKSHRHALGVAV